MTHSLEDWLTLISATVILLMGVKLLWQDQKNSVYVGFFLSTLLLYFQNLFFFEMNHAETLEQVSFLRRFQEPIWCIATMTILFTMRHYALLFMHRPEYKWERITYWVLMAISPIFVFLQAFTDYGHGKMVGEPGGWLVMVHPMEWIDWFRAGWILVLSFLAVYFCYLAYKYAVDQKSKKLRLAIFLVFGIILFGSFIQNYIIPAIYEEAIPYNESISILIAVVFCGLMVTNFKFFEIRPEYAMQNTLKTMTNWFILTDINFLIKEVNQVVIRTVSNSGTEFEKKNILDIIPEDQWSLKLRTVTELQPHQSLVFEVQFAINKENQRSILFTVSPIFDEREHKLGYVFVGTDLTSFLASQNKIKQYSQELESSNEALERFAYIASHDLKEPIRNIGNFAGLLKRRLKGQANVENQEFLKYITDNVKGMNRLIESIMKMSLIGQDKFLSEVVNTERVVYLVQKNLVNQFNARNAHITTENLMPIYGDQELIKQLLQNLIENSIKYNHSKRPHIHISCRASENPHFWEFRLEDNGIGIPVEFGNQIFQMFKRLHSRNEYEGTGIGLAICRRIVELHQGKIWVKSPGEGKGSVFYMTLPQAPYGG